MDESARKAELVALLVDYSATHGLSAVSLRPLATAIAETGAWAGFARDSVADWLPLITRMLYDEHLAGATTRAATATLVWAALRGLLLDLLATGDRDRVESAFELLDRLLRPSDRT